MHRFRVTCPQCCQGGRVSVLLGFSDWYWWCHEGRKVCISSGKVSYVCIDCTNMTVVGWPGWLWREKKRQSARHCNTICHHDNVHLICKRSHFSPLLNFISAIRGVPTMTFPPGNGFGTIWAKMPDLEYSKFISAVRGTVLGVMHLSFVDNGNIQSTY